jgi:hypothetical protein
VRIRVQVGVETGRIVLIRVEVFLSLFFFLSPSSLDLVIGMINGLAM